MNYDMLISLPSTHLELGKNLRDALLDRKISAYLYDTTINDAAWLRVWSLRCLNTLCDLIYICPQNGRGKYQKRELQLWEEGLLKKNLSEDDRPYLFNLSLTESEPVPIEDSIGAGPYPWRERKLISDANLNFESTNDCWNWATKHADKISDFYWSNSANPRARPHASAIIAMNRPELQELIKPRSRCWCRQVNSREKKTITEALRQSTLRYQNDRKQFILRPNNTEGGTAQVSLDIGLGRRGQSAIDVTDALYECRSVTDTSRLLTRLSKHSTNNFTFFAIIDMASILHNSTYSVYQRLLALRNEFRIVFLFQTFATLDADEAHGLIFRKLRDEHLLNFVHGRTRIPPSDLAFEDPRVDDCKSDFFFNIATPGGVKHAVALSVLQHSHSPFDSLKRSPPPHYS